MLTEECLKIADNLIEKNDKNEIKAKEEASNPRIIYKQKKVMEAFKTEIE